MAVRTVVFNTASRLGTDAGVLLFWAMLSAGTMALFTWWVRRRDRDRNRGRRGAGTKKAKAKAKAGFETGRKVRMPYGRSGSGRGVCARRGEGGTGLGGVDQGEKGEEARRGEGGVEMGERGRKRERERDRDRGGHGDRVDAAGREEMGRLQADEGCEDDQDEEGRDAEDGWKRANVDLGLAPVESRRSGTEVIAFQA